MTYQPLQPKNGPRTNPAVLPSAATFCSELAEYRDILKSDTAHSTAVSSVEPALREVEQILTDNSHLVALTPRKRYGSDLCLIRDRFGLHTASLLVPGHGDDVSCCQAFPCSPRIVNIDLLPRAVYMMRNLYSDDPRIVSLLGDIQYYRAEKPVDVVVALLVDPPGDLSVLTPGGILVTTYGMHLTRPLSSQLSFQGVAGFGQWFSVDELARHESVVQTVEELVQATRGHSEHNQRAKDVMAAIDPSSVKEGQYSWYYRYAQLRESMMTQEIERQKAAEVSPERIARFAQYGLHPPTNGDSYWKDLYLSLSRRPVNAEVDGKVHTLEPLPALASGKADFELVRCAVGSIIGETSDLMSAYDDLRQRAAQQLQNSRPEQMPDKLTSKTLVLSHGYAQYVLPPLPELRLVSALSLAVYRYTPVAPAAS